jgi:hypothetical protein
MGHGKDVEGELGLNGVGLYELFVGAGFLDIFRELVYYRRHNQASRIAI